jgi:sugar phosphate isomerase/epimerase
MGTCDWIPRAGLLGMVSPRRLMTIDLMLHMIGFQGELPEAIALAHQNRFESVAPDAGYLARLSDGQVHELLGDLQRKGLIFGAARLAIDFRGDEDRFEAGIKDLTEIAKALERARVTRTGTYIKPSHETLTYRAIFKQHVRRLGVMARVLGDHGLRFGLEYVAPRTSWTSARHSFIHTMAETRELIAEIGQANVGLVLDSWHWYHAEETEADLLALTDQDVVACEINDAPAGIPRAQQMDMSRELPGATGIINIKTFLGALAKIGYNGPVRAEPFNAELRKLALPQAVAAVAQALKKTFDLIDTAR